MEAAVEITDATFETEVLRSPGLTIVDLWAEWCMPCKNLAPILDQIATEYTGKIKVTKLDVDANPAVPGQYGVTGIPTLAGLQGWPVGRDDRRLSAEGPTASRSCCPLLN